MSQNKQMYNYIIMSSFNQLVFFLTSTQRLLWLGLSAHIYNIAFDSESIQIRARFALSPEFD